MVCTGQCTFQCNSDFFLAFKEPQCKVQLYGASCDGDCDDDVSDLTS